MNRREFLKVSGLSVLASIFPRVTLPDTVEKQKYIPHEVFPDKHSGRIFYQNSKAPLLYAPDKDGKYWGLRGTSKYPVYDLGIFDYVTFVHSYPNPIDDTIDIEFTINNPAWPFMVYEQTVSSKERYHLQFYANNYTMYFYKTVCYELDFEHIHDRQYILRYRSFPTKYGNGVLINE